MKIGYIFGGRFEAAAIGGNATDIREDLLGMDTLGHEVAFRPYEVGEIQVPDQIRIAKSRVPRPIWDTARDVALLRRDLVWRRRLLRDEALRGSDLVFEYWFPDSFGGHALAARLGVPHVLENVDPITDDDRERDRRGPLNALMRGFERRRRGAAAAIVVMSRGMKEHLVGSGVDADRVHVMPQGVNTALFAPPSRDVRAATRAELGVGGQHLVGFVGSMASYQRVDVLVDAARRLHSARSDVRVVLVGGNETRARALGIRDEAEVISNVPYERVPALVGAFDVAVLPDSNWYGSPVKVLEYGAVGVPLVAPDVGPVRDLVEDGVDGILVPPGDAEELARAITVTLGDPTAARERADRFRQKVLERFDRTRRTAQLLDLCARLVEESR